MRPFFVAPLTFIILFSAACGSSSEPGSDASADDGGDGKYHPATNGMAMSEADACNAIAMAQDARHTALSCPATSRPCPELLRAEFSTSCLQYDQGSVEGCVAYYGMPTTCADLAMAIDNCVIAPIVDSAPAGCP